MKQVNIFGRRQKSVARKQVRESVAALQAAAGRMREVALHWSNTIDTTAGETLSTKIGWIPDGKGNRKKESLAKHLCKVLMLPGWSTHMVLTFSVDRTMAAGGDPKDMQHLSVTIHVPGQYTTDHLRPVKDEFIQKTFNEAFIRMFFPTADGVLTAIRAGEVVRDDNDATWTPVVTHFYAEHVTC